MAVLQASDITDLANTTLSELGRFRMVDLTTDLREHVAMSNLMRKNQVRIGSGESIKWNALEDNDDNARNVGLYNRDSTNVKDGSLILEIPWRHTQTSCAFDVREQAMNNSPAKIVDYVKEKLQMSMGSLVELMEANFWQGVSGSSDSETPFGLFGYWLDGANIATSFDFNGTNGNYGTIGGQDCGSHTRLKHGCIQYTNVTDSDLVDGLRDCITLTKFKPTVTNAPLKEYANGERRVMYTTWTVVKGLEKLARSNNDSLGSDLDKYGGAVRINQLPVREVPYLTENKGTSHPVVGLDWKQCHTCVLAGRWGIRRKFKEKEGQHNVREQFTDFSYNFRIFNRRTGIFLAAKSDPLSS